MFGGERYSWDSRVFCVSQWFIRMIVCSVVRDVLWDNTVFCGQSMFIEMIGYPVFRDVL